MPEKKLLILGAGGFGQSIAEIAELLGRWKNIYFVDDQWPEQQYVNGYKIISNIPSLGDLNKHDFEAIVAIGNNKIRQKLQHLLLDLSIPMTTIIHPQAIIAPSAKIGEGASVMAGCVIGTNTLIQEGVILNIGTLLDHDVIIEAFAHLSLGVKVAGGKIIAKHSFLEVGTCIPH